MRLPQPERPQRRGIRLASGIVDLIGDEHHGHPGLAEDPHHGLVGVEGADSGIHDEHDDVGIGHGALGLGGDLPRHPPRIALPSAGVDELEVAAVPPRLVRNAVAGDAGHILHHGLATPQDPVDQGRLADVGTPHHGHRGEEHVRADLIGRELLPVAELPQRGLARRRGQGRLVVVRLIQLPRLVVEALDGLKVTSVVGSGVEFGILGGKGAHDGPLSPGASMRGTSVRPVRADASAR